MNIMFRRTSFVAFLKFLTGVAIVLTGLSFTMQAQAETRGVNLGATRLIYNSSQKAVATDIINNEPVPYLIQSWVEDVNGKRDNRFLVTPPLFRMEAKSSGRIRVAYAGGALPADRDTVNWLVVRYIPSEANVTSVAGEGGVSGQLKLSTRIRVKLFYRPEGLLGTPDEAGSQLQWIRQGQQLIAKNTSAYSVSLAGVKIKGISVSNGAVVPSKGQLVFPLKSPLAVNGSELLYGVIDDFGGIKNYTKKL